MISLLLAQWFVMQVKHGKRLQRAGGRLANNHTSRQVKKRCQYKTASCIMWKQEKEPGIGGYSCHHPNSDSADRASTSPQTLRFEGDEGPNELAVSKSQRRCFIPLKRKEDIWMAGPIPSIDIHSLPEHDLVSCCCSKKLFPKKVQHLSQVDHKL